MSLEDKDKEEAKPESKDDSKAEPKRDAKAKPKPESKTEPKPEPEKKSEAGIDLDDLPESISELGEEPPVEAPAEDDSEDAGYSKLEEEVLPETRAEDEPEKAGLPNGKAEAAAKAKNLIGTVLTAKTKTKTKTKTEAKAEEAGCAKAKKVVPGGGVVEKRSRMETVSLALAALLGMSLVGGMVALWQVFGSAGQELPQGALFVAQFHPIFVHFPVTLLVVVLLMEMLSIFPIWRNLRENTLFLLWLAALGSGASIVAGYLLKVTGEYGGPRVESHMWLGMIVGVGACALLTLKSARAAGSVYRIILALTVFVLLLTGHLGGTITHGPDYLVKQMPEPYRSWPIFDDGRFLSLFGAISGEDKEGVTGRLYDDYVAPVLGAKCTQCHGVDKQKGKLRLDTHEFVIKGAEGSDYMNVVIGKPDESELLARVHLPLDDDDHMPPDGEPQLTPEEVDLLTWWIGKGKASAHLVVADVAIDMELAAILKELGPPQVAKKQEVADKKGKKGGDSAPAKLPESERDRAITEIQSKGYALRGVSAQDEGLIFNAVNVADEFDDGALALFEPVAGRIVELRLGKTRITDKSGALLGQMSSLVTLHLEQTGVTDALVAELGELDHLEYLNLYGTNVSDASIEKLLELDSLKTVYLWQTRVTIEGAERLREAKAGLTVDMGWAEKKTGE